MLDLRDLYLNEDLLEYLLVREQKKHSKWAEEHGGQ